MIRRNRLTSSSVAILIVAALAGAWASSAWGDTSVGGSISTDTTWTLAGSPYVMTDNVTVETGATLTVEPGVQVKSLSKGLYVYGTLNAQGTSGDPIIFTSSSASPAAGNWKGIYFGSAAGASQLDYVTVEYAGGYYLIHVHGADKSAAIYVDECSPSITHCRIAQSGRHGIELWTSDAILQNSSFEDMGSAYYPVCCDDANSFPVMGGNTTTGTGKNAVYVSGGSMSTSGQWFEPGTDFPYVLGGNVEVQAGTTLTIAPGVTVKSYGTALRVYGTLDARGSEGEPITFTSTSATPAAGQWKGIYLGPDAGASQLEYMTVEYAGGYYLIHVHDADRSAAVYVDGCQASIAHCRIANSARHGVELWMSEAAIQSNTFENMGNSYYPICYDDVNTFPSITGNTTTGTGKNAVYVSGGVMATSGQWPKLGPDFPYVLGGNVEIQSGTALTVAAGVTVKSYGTVLHVHGTLDARGSETEPIIFTSVSATPAAGNWKGIYFGPDAGASQLEYATVDYAGGYYLINVHGANRAASVYVDGCDASITHCRIANSAYNGLELWASRATLQDIAFENMGTSSYPLCYDTVETFPVIGGNTTTGTGQNAVYVPGGVIATLGCWPKPGSDFPYVLGGNVEVEGGATLTIDPGVVLKGLSYGIYVRGILAAKGSPNDPIVFTSSRTSPVPSDWSGIYLAPTAGASSLEHVVVEYAGRSWLIDVHDALRATTLYVDDCSPTISDCRIAHSNSHGIETWNCHGTMSNIVVHSCGASGIVAEGGTTATFVNCTVASCGDSGVCSVDSSPTVTNTIVSGNDEGIRQSGTGTCVLAYNDVWGNVSADYVGVTDPTGTNGNLSQNPLFAGSADYHLTDSSPCIDAADGSVAPLTDADGIPRYDVPEVTNTGVGPPWVDMGASEFLGTAHVLNVASTPFADVVIAGTPSQVGGTTSYAVAMADGSEVGLVAPASITKDYCEYEFIQWIVDDVPQTVGAIVADLLLEADATAVAAYEISQRKGDFDRDGDVDFWDFMAFIDVYGMTDTDPGWLPDCHIGDFDANNCVDFWDFMHFIDVYGT